MNCKYCNQSVPDASIFCMYCGERLARKRKEAVKKISVPEPRKLPSGSYFLQLRLNGVSVPVTAATAQDCVRKAELIKTEYKNGTRKISRAVSLKDAIDKYIEKRENVLSPSTVTGYRNIQKKRFAAWMQKPISEVHAGLQQMVNDETPLCSPRTLKNSLRLVQSALKENGYPSVSVTAPIVVQKTRPFLEPEQIRTLVASVKGTRASLPVLFALHSLRRSELCALTWADIDLGSKCFTVSASVVKDEHNRFVKKEVTKNASSTRTLPIMIPELESELSAVPEEDRTGPVIQIHPDRISVVINEACRAAGVPEVGTHGLRHSFASLAYHLHLSELETMQLGGWSDNQTMHRIYTHLAQKDRLNAENKVSEFFQNANGNANEDKKSQ